MLKEHLFLKIYEKTSRIEFAQGYLKFCLDFFADQDLKSLFEATGLDLEFVPYEVGLTQTEKKPRMVKLRFRTKKYLIPKSAFIAQEGREVFVWLDGRYARAMKGRETLILISEETFAELPVKAVVYEAIRINDDDDSSPPPVMTFVNLRRAKVGL